MHACAYASVWPAAHSAALEALPRSKPPLILADLREEPVERCYDQVRDDEHVPLQPGRHAVRDDGERQQDCKDQDGGVHRPEVQVHRLVDRPADDDSKGHHEQGNLSRGPHGDADGDVHLLGHGHAYRPHVLAGVAHDGQQDDANEGFAQLPLLDQAVDRSHQEFGGHGYHGGRDCQQQHGTANGQLWLQIKLRLLLVRGGEGFSMRVKLEEEVGHVGAEDVGAAVS
mmetsp:Transcript_70463/g.206141  ORF Transcript_70463/g.206141 Transcript_70463/m.206141 type:complete len:227 (-) Transcript_70463:825-1505(-)